MTNPREGKTWPRFVFGGRMRTSTLVLIIAFIGIGWLYETYEPPPPQPDQVPASEVVPPGFIPDPAYTWAPRTAVQTRPPTPTPTTPTTTETEAPTTEGEPSTSPEVSSGVPPAPGPPTPVPPTPVPSTPALSTPVEPRPAETPVTPPRASGTATSPTPAPPAR
ncbi:MAG: hypothetical protein WCJ98_08305 [Mycobacteriaceae bacterium]|jgi:hypothetical protein